MSSLNSLVGRGGRHVVETTLVSRLKTWAVNPKLATHSEWGDSDTAGFTARAEGRHDATFDTAGVYDTANEQFDLFQEGDILISTLWMNLTTLYWDFPRSLCMDFKLNVNIETEEVIGWDSSWGADGVYYRPGEAGAPARTLP
jgi:hypothetical protein